METLFVDLQRSQSAQDTIWVIAHSAKRGDQFRIAIGQQRLRRGQGKKCRSAAKKRLDEPRSHRCADDRA